MKLALPPSQPSSLGLFLLILVVIGLLSAFDLSLARLDSAETRVQAQRYYDVGTGLLGAKRAVDAIDPLRKAHAMDRNDPKFALQLASALIQANKLDEAQALLTDLLARTPNDGEANLLEARLMVRQNRVDDATASYHRAIYGTWSTNQDARRIQARMELANLLVSQGSKQDLLAELLPLETLLESEAPGDIASRRQTAQLFLVAGSPARAEAAYRALLRDDPNDALNDEGLGEAELATGDYRAAQAAFQNAGARQQAALAAEMAGLDPTVRRLSSAEKFERSVRILEMARDAAVRCQPQNEALIQSADKALSAKIRGAVTNELAEERLSLAQTLWMERQAGCKSNPDDDVLSKLMPKLVQ